MSEKIQELLKDPCLECHWRNQCSLRLILKNSPVPFDLDAFIEAGKFTRQDLRDLRRCQR